MAASRLSGREAEKNREIVNQQESTRIGLSRGVLMNKGFAVWILSRNNNERDATTQIKIKV